MSELADMLAKKGATPVQGPEPFLPIPSNMLKGRIHEGMREWWKKRWKRENTCRQTREILPEISNRKLMEIPRTYAKNDLCIIMAWATGHCVLLRHLVIMNIKEHNMCRL